MGKQVVSFVTSNLFNSPFAREKRETNLSQIVQKNRFM